MILFGKPCHTTCMKDVLPRLWENHSADSRKGVRMSCLEVEREGDTFGVCVCGGGGLYHATYINHRQLHISTRQGVSACLASFFSPAAENICVMQDSSACTGCCSSRGRATGHEVWYLNRCSWSSSPDWVWMQKGDSAFTAVTSLPVLARTWLCLKWHSARLKMDPAGDLQNEKATGN